MYQALRHFKNVLPGGQIVRLQPGDEVVGFETWDSRYQQAALSTHMVRVRPDDAIADNVALRPSHEEVRCWSFDTLREATARQREAMRPSETVSYEAQDAGPIEQVIPVDLASGITLVCPSCDFTTQSPQGFKTHQARKHRE